MPTSFTRRRFLQLPVVGAASVVVADHLLTAPTALAATATRSLKSYTQPLQLMPIIDLTGSKHEATISATQQTRQLHPSLPAPTHVFQYLSADAVDPNPTGYKGFLGPTVVARRGNPVTLTFVNAIAATHYSQTPWLPCDRNLTSNHDDIIRILTHQHGGFVWAQFDGNPAVDVGYTNTGDRKEPHAQTVWYGNEQRAGLNWYHDHGMGNTRLNVWSGLAGGYLIRDEFDTGAADNPCKLPAGIGLGPGCYELPMVFQDRSFTSQTGNGDFFYPTITQLGLTGGSWGVAGNDPNWYGTVPGPWIPEAFGNQMLVNGLCAPYHQVEPRLYRLRLLNGCNARILDLAPTASTVTELIPPMWIIGMEGGLLPAPVPTKSLVMMPGERLDVLIDFTGFQGSSILLKNTNPPHPYSSPAPTLSDGIQFRVGTTISSTANNTVPTTIPGGATANPGTPTIEPRHVSMNEANPLAPRWFMALTGSGGGGIDVPPTSAVDAATGQRFNTSQDPIAELPPMDSVQDWDFDNQTTDSHPMHMHLVMFQVVHRRPSGTSASGVAEGTGVAASELGWKDTVAVHPSQITRVRVKFSLPQPPPRSVADPAGFVANASGFYGTSPEYQLTRDQARRTYMYHCHILEHEENDMMRPFRVS